MIRPSWDLYFMQVALLLANRATCDRKKVGAVIVNSDHRILTTGYNGSPPGMPHCDEVGHLLATIDGRHSCMRTVHAEENAILQAAILGTIVQGGTLYTTASPCYDCLKRSVSVKIQRVVFAEKYDSARSIIDMANLVQLYHLEM